MFSHEYIISDWTRSGVDDLLSKACIE